MDADLHEKNPKGSLKNNRLNKDSFGKIQCGL